MSDIMLLDIEPAISLQQRMVLAAQNLDFDAHALAGPLAEAFELLGSGFSDAVPGVQRAATDLRSSANDLHNRIQVVLAGGHEMNSGLAALERIRSKFTLIETRGNSSRADGKLSLGDLAWASHQLDEETSSAAAWLSEHKDFFARVETAKDNDRYINQPYNNEFSYNPKDADGVLRIADIDAFFAKTEAWATLLPYASVIDTAHGSGSPDGKLTKKDFEAFLNDYDLSPDVAKATRQVLDDGAYHKKSGFFKGWLTWGMVMDGVGFVPVIGDVVDAARAIYYSVHGDWKSAGIYALGLVPLPGLSGSGVKAAVTVTKSAVKTIRKSGYEQAARETGKVLQKGTMYNWTANTAAEALANPSNCSSTHRWIAQQAGIDIEKVDNGLRKTTGKDVGRIKNRLSDITGHDLGVADGFFSDACEVIAQRMGEHKFSKLWIPK